jgi:transcriptional regulator with XRE-family HTH domain
MFFQRLEDLRVDNDKTQQEIASLLTCKREVYRRYEKGTNEIPVWAVLKLATFYGTSVDYILGITDIKEPYPKAERDEMK